MALCSAPVFPLQTNASPYTARELSLLPRKALKMIAEEEGISTVGNKDEIRERILLGKKKSKTGRKIKTPVVETMKEASKYQELFQGASEEKIAEILAKKEEMKKEMIEKSPLSYEFGAGKVIKTASKMTDDEMTANNCSLVNIINQGEGKKFVYRVHVASLDEEEKQEKEEKEEKEEKTEKTEKTEKKEKKEKKEFEKGKKKDQKPAHKKDPDGQKKRKLAAAVATKPVKSSKKGKKKESAISIDELRKKFKSYSKHVQKEVVQLMGGRVNSRGGSTQLADEFVTVLMEEEDESASDDESVSLSSSSDSDEDSEDESDYESEEDSSD